MEKILQSIYIQVDASYETLTNSAIAQLLIKLLFRAATPVSTKELLDIYTNDLPKKSIDKAVYSKILEQLVDKHEIQYKNQKYYLSTAKKKKIQQSIDEAHNRIEQILQKYFKGKYHSSDEIVSRWFEDVTFRFFEIYADAWISSLLEAGSAINNQAESIKSTIENRTKSFPDIDKRDLNALPTLFFGFITTRDPIVDAYLWEHGTSRFAAQLISNRHGINQLTIDAFKNSTCVLDTNILIFIALAAGSVKDSFKLLEQTFQQLNINSQILYITSEEYRHRVSAQRDATLNNISHFGTKNSSNIANDDFTKCAKALHCESEEDFERFFDEIQDFPEVIHENVEIELFDGDKQLNDVITRAQNDEDKKQHLNSLYIAVKNREKRPNALTHDVGLIEGVKNLRANGHKVFILSEEASINAYSKNQPLDKGLPLAIGIDTLLNVLATNGGTITDSSEYTALYATLIRHNLYPHEQTFTQCQLYELYKLNNRIAKLTEEETERIAWEAHEKMVKGLPEEDLRLFINDTITASELALRDEISKKDEELDSVKLGLKKETHGKQKYKNAFEESIYNEEHRKLFRKMIFRCVVWPMVILSVIIGVLCCLPLFSDNLLEIQGQIIIGILSSIAASLIYDKFAHATTTFKEWRNRKSILRDRVQKRIDEIENQ